VGWAQAGIALAMMFVELGVGRATFGLPVGAALAQTAPVLIACGVMAVIVRALTAPLAAQPDLVQIAVGSAGGALAYALALGLVARRFVATGLAVLRGALERRQPNWEGARP